MKTKETMEIENTLLNSCFAPNNPKLAKEYGKAEVTIGFQRDKMGHERVDFLSYDPIKDVFRCYEIKVSMSDFNSNAKKSWYGNYNYLVLSENLYNKRTLEEWKNDIPDYVGIITIKKDCKKSKKPAKCLKISCEQKEMLKNSLLRSLFYSDSASRDL